MLSKLIFLFVLLCAVSAFDTARIIGGTTANIEDFPYQVSVRKYGNHTCGGSIISANWALTASHCVYKLPTNIFHVVVGSSFRTTGGTKHQAMKIVMHPKYNDTTMDFDYALIKVSPPFPIGSKKVQVIKLANSTTPVGTMANVTGWGFTSGGAHTLPDKLWKVQLPVVKKADCQRSYVNNTITDRMFCAGFQEGGKDTCVGDSGGPLVVRGKQIGIVSWGYGCAIPKFPGIFSDVYYMRDWIKNTAGL